MNVLLHGKSSVRPGTGPYTYLNLLIRSLDDRCTFGEYSNRSPDTQDWDLIHVLDMKQLPRKFFKNVSLPVILDLHDTYWLEKVPYPCPDRWGRLWLARRRRKSYPILMSQASRIVVHSRFVFRTLRDWLPVDQRAKLIQVPYAVMIPDHIPAKTTAGNHRILFAGRDLFRKGFPTLIEAVDLLLKRMSRLELAVVGDEYRHSMSWAKRRCRGLPVSFLGALSPADLRREILASKVVVLSSYTEAFGIILLEAQALGVPVIGTRVGGIPETMAEKETGLLVPPYDSGALADCLEESLTNPERLRMMGEFGREWVAKKFSPDQMANALMELYQSVSEARRSRTPADLST